MLSLEQRIERALRAVTLEEGASYTREVVTRAVRAAYPELHDGTHWLAPIALPEEMSRAVLEAKPADWVDRVFWQADFEHGWNVVRDAYLKNHPSGMSQAKKEPA